MVELTPKPEWLDAERAQIDVVYATVISQGCICDWVADDKLWRMVERKRHCVYHGERGIF
jgi:hypothetical protein